MAILTVGQNVTFQLNLKVLKAFAFDDSIYYIVGIRKSGSPIQSAEGPLWGVLNVDGSCESIPPEVQKRAEELIPTVNFNNLE